MPSNNPIGQATNHPAAPPVLFTAVPVGSILPVELNQGLLNATGTSCTAMVFLQ
jgi:hypothetical protein